MLFTIVFILTSPVCTQVYVFSEIQIQIQQTMKPYCSQLNENVNELINIPSNPFGLIAYLYGVLF